MTNEEEIKELNDAVWRQIYQDLKDKGFVTNAANDHMKDCRADTYLDNH